MVNMPYYSTPTAEIYDFMEELGKSWDKCIQRNNDEDGAIYWQIGRRRFDTNFNEAFDEMLLRQEIREVTPNYFLLTDRGEEEKKAFAKEWI